MDTSYTHIDDTLTHIYMTLLHTYRWYSYTHIDDIILFKNLINKGYIFQTIIQVVFTSHVETLPWSYRLTYKGGSARKTN
jgi:hypothetical protein